MSRQPQLPPRCPISKTNSPICKNGNFHSHHQKSVSQSHVLEEHPAWLDDLLGDWDLGLKIKSHRRAASDSGTVLDNLDELPFSNIKKDDKSSCSLEPACVYGPNSPRSKEKVCIQESVIVSGSHGFLQYDNADLFVQDVCGSVGEVNMEAKPFKRHSGQRSRVRKLQYIAELERTVENFQNIVTELAIRVDALVEQRVYLSLENKQLKQQLAMLRQEKFVMDGQYQSMKNEVERLKLHDGSKVRTHFRSNSVGANEKLLVEATWHMLDMAKLHINRQI